MEKKLVSKFIENYVGLKNDTVKTGQVHSIIRRTYCPLLEKKLILEMMAEKSAVMDPVPYIDMVLSKLNLTMAILALYTYLEVDKDENGVPKTFEAYDLLIQYDLLNAICNEIGEREINELLSVQEAVLDTWHTKNTSTEAYISGLVEKASEKIGVVAGAGAQQLAEVFEDETKINRLIDTWQNKIKKIKK